MSRVLVIGLQANYRLSGSAAGNSFPNEQEDNSANQGNQEATYVEPSYPRASKQPKDKPTKECPNNTNNDITQ